jgi:hypothetical protein
MLHVPPRSKHKTTPLLAIDDVVERNLDAIWYTCTVVRVNHKQQTVDIHYKDTGNTECNVPYDQDLRPVVPRGTAKTHQQPNMGNPVQNTTPRTTSPSWLLESQKAVAQSARRQEAYQTTQQYSQEIMDRATKVETQAKAQQEQNNKTLEAARVSLGLRPKTDTEEQSTPPSAPRRVPRPPPTDPKECRRTLEFDGQQKKQQDEARHRKEEEQRKKEAERKKGEEEAQRKTGEKQNTDTARTEEERGNWDDMPVLIEADDDDDEVLTLVGMGFGEAKARKAIALKRTVAAAVEYLCNCGGNSDDEEEEEGERTGSSGGSTGGTGVQERRTANEETKVRDGSAANNGHGSHKAADEEKDAAVAAAAADELRFVVDIGGERKTSDVSSAEEMKNQHEALRAEYHKKVGVLADDGDSSDSSDDEDTAWKKKYRKEDRRLRKARRRRGMPVALDDAALPLAWMLQQQQQVQQQKQQVQQVQQQQVHQKQYSPRLRALLDCDTVVGHVGGWARRIDFAREPSVSDSSAPSVLLTQFMGHDRTRWSLNHVIDLTPYAARCQQCHVKWSASR